MLVVPKFGHWGPETNRETEESGGILTISVLMAVTGGSFAGLFYSCSPFLHTLSQQRRNVARDTLDSHLH